MSGNTIVLFYVIGLIISVVVSFKFKFNLGIMGLFFTFVIGTLICKVNINTILTYWPYKVLFTLMSLPLFFGYAAQNGTIEIITERLMYTFRKASWASPIAIFFVSIIVSTLGAGNFATVAMIGPLAFASCAAADISPLMTTTILLGANLGGSMYWAGGAATTAALMENAGFATDISKHISIVGAFNQIPIVFVLFAVIYILLKGWKAKSLVIDTPKSPNKKQKQTMVIMLFVLLIALLSMILYTFIKTPFTQWMANYLDIRILCIIACVVCTLMKLGDEKALVRNLPWNTIFMITGIGLLMGLAQANGLSNILAKWMTGKVPLWLVPAGIFLVASFMTFFTSALTVVYPVMLPIGLALCKAYPALNMTEVVTAILIGGTMTAMSPFSSGGSLLLSTCNDEKVRDSLVPRQFAFSFAYLGFSTVLILLGILKFIH